MAQEQRPYIACIMGWKLLNGVAQILAAIDTLFLTVLLYVGDSIGFRLMFEANSISTCDLRRITSVSCLTSIELR
jgi:hypothetical protein